MELQILNFPDCPKCRQGKLLPISKIIHEYDTQANAYCPDFLSSTMNPFSNWKCSNCDHKI